MGTPPVPSIVLNLLVVLLTVVAWLQMSLGRPAGDKERLSTGGLTNLKYFTVQSNLLSGIACAAYLILGCVVGSVPVWLLALKLVATTAVMITFSTVTAILNKKYGWRRMYSGANLWMHLILPLLAAMDCCFFVAVGLLPVWVTALGILPTLLYGIGYIAAWLRHGAEENDAVYDFYGFTRWGKDKVSIVMLVMLLCSWGICALLYGANVLLLSLA